jgi:VCBS repeat-containing protein
LVASDIDSPTLSFSGVTQAAHGTVTVNADGFFTYTPNANYNGPDSFTYKANDGQTDSNVATVNLNIVPANDAPVANDDIAGLTRGRTISTDTLHGVLSNDSDPDGDPLHVSALNGSSASVGKAIGGTYGTLTLNADGSYIYTAGDGALLPNHAVAQDTFSYAVGDQHGGTGTATLTVTVMNTDQTYFQGTGGNNTLVGGNGREVLDGGNGNDILRGGNGTDFLIGGCGNDVLTGGAGDDTIVFAPHFGNDVATDFTPGTDFIQFDRTLFASFSDVQAHAANDGQGNTVITYDANNTITLQHVALASLHATDFLFV